MKENVLERNARMDTDRKIADFRVKQQMDYAFKMKYARIRAWEFYNHPDVAGNCYVAVGGLDSITLLLFLRSIGIDVPAVSVSSLEDKSIQRVHKQLGVQPEQLVAVSVPDSMEEADQTRAISAVLEQVAENDNLYIDLSGGMRDTATLLLIVARYLKDIRMVQTKKVLYSELKGNSSVVRDSTGLYNLMDLITAVDAFFSTGTTEKLKAYMKQTGETDPDILNLLDRIDHFADDLALYRKPLPDQGQD